MRQGCNLNKAWEWKIGETVWEEWSLSEYGEIELVFQCVLTPPSYPPPRLRSEPWVPSSLLPVPRRTERFSLQDPRLKWGQPPALWLLAALVRLMILSQDSLGLSLLSYLLEILSFILKRVLTWDFPSGPVAKMPGSQHRGPWFNLWSGN